MLPEAVRRANREVGRRLQEGPQDRNAEAFPEYRHRHAWIVVVRFPGGSYGQTLEAAAPPEEEFRLRRAALEAAGGWEAMLCKSEVELFPGLAEAVKDVVSIDGAGLPWKRNGATEATCRCRGTWRSKDSPSVKCSMVGVLLGVPCEFS